MVAYEEILIIEHVFHLLLSCVVLVNNVKPICYAICNSNYNVGSVSRFMINIGAYLLGIHIFQIKYQLELGVVN